MNELVTNAYNLNTKSLLDYQTSLGAVTGASGKAEEIPVDQNGKTFSEYVGEAVTTLSGNMNTINQDMIGVITGEESDLGAVMTRLAETQIALETAVQVRNKCLEAYNDVKSMQF